MTTKCRWIDLFLFYRFEIRRVPRLLYAIYTSTHKGRSQNVRKYANIYYDCIPMGSARSIVRIRIGYVRIAVFLFRKSRVCSA